ncbi:TPA: ead/Ea22-like family protein [Serratia marcescens]
MDKFSELKAAAMAATPGPWGINRTGNTIVSNHSHPVATVSDAFHRQLAGGGVGKDAEFIAAANPAAVLELLAELEVKDKRIAELEVTQMTGPLALMLERLSVLERITEGVDQLAIDGGWTARGMSEYAKSLERRLATPVRLPRPACTYADHSYPAYSRKQVEEIVSSSGMSFTAEGDE